MEFLSAARLAKLEEMEANIQTVSNRMLEVEKTIGKVTPDTSTLRSLYSSLLNPWYTGTPSTHSARLECIEKKLDLLFDHLKIEKVKVPAKTILRKKKA